MSTPSDRRSRKRLVTRQAISNVATRLFAERGFDRVTIDEIAEAADVGRMTVFNHFPRKEDMFFDRDEEGRQVLQKALRERDPHVSPIETLRLLAHQLVADRSPYIEFSDASRTFIETIERSEALKARARAIRDELGHFVAAGLSESVGCEPEEPDARLAASLLLAIWATALDHAHCIFRQSGDADRASAGFLAMVERGSVGVAAAMAGTPYADAESRNAPGG